MPPLQLAPLFPKLDRASQALGRLDGLTTLLPDTSLFLYLYVRKEALLSSQIPAAAQALAISTPTIAASIRHLEGLGIVHEVTGRQRGRTFLYGSYLSILAEGTEPLAP